MESSPVLVGKTLASATGYGMMGLTRGNEPLPTRDHCFAALKEALAHGANFWNAGENYGTADNNSLHLLRDYFARYPEDADRVILSVKGGGLDGSAANVRERVQVCLDVLEGTKRLDIWEPARVDPKVPIEVTVRAAEEFVKAGTLGGIGLSECNADTIRRAAAVATIAAVEVEVSLWTTDIFTNGVAKACANLGIPVIAYSPLGRGILTGSLRTRADMPEGDRRLTMPRFSDENLAKNIELVDEVDKIANAKGCTPGQVALAWIKARSGQHGHPVLIPIPGTTSISRIRENHADVRLTGAESNLIDGILSRVKVAGPRYEEHLLQWAPGHTPKET